MPIDRKYVIASGLVAFVAWAYLTDWAPSLRWIPHAFVAGSLAATAALILLATTTSKGVRCRDDSTITAPTRPAFSASTEAWEEETAALRSRTEYRRPMIFPEAALFSRAVDDVLDLILRDRVTSWYGNITNRPLFQHEIDRCIRSVLLTSAARMTGFDMVQIGVAKVLPIVTGHLRDFYEAEHLVRGHDLKHNVTESEELNSAIAGNYRTGRLHPAASMTANDTATAQSQHLRALVARLLPIVLPDSMKTSPSVLVLIREIVACAVLTPVIGILLDPDFINQTIVSVGGPMLRDRKAVRKVRAALEKNAPVSPKQRKDGQLPRLRPYDGERQFERFIHAVKSVSTTGDARKYRSAIMSQLRRDGAVQGQDAAYLRRLETARRLLDQKIESLSANRAANPELTFKPSRRNGEVSARKRRASLREVLYDASGLGYFMEYMNGLDLVSLVQFYLVVDGIRGPLQGDHGDIELSTDSPRLDLALMYESYLIKPELQTSEPVLQLVRRYLKAGAQATEKEYSNAYRAVLQTQTQIFETMRDRHYDSFKQSSSYLKWLVSDDTIASASSSGKRPDGRLSLDSLQQHIREPSPVKARRPQLAAMHKEPELRRAVLSSSNLKDFAPPVRRSLDDDANRSPLFDDDADDETMTRSLTSLRSYNSDTEGTDNGEDESSAVDAMKLALDNIVRDDNAPSPVVDSADLTDTESPSAQYGSALVSRDLDRKRSATSLSRQSSPPLSADLPRNGKPSLSSLGLVGALSEESGCTDDMFTETPRKSVRDDKEAPSRTDESDEDRIQEAAPGDLGLIEAISALDADIDRLTAQSHIVDSLTAKAELTNNSAELRILRKSEQSLQREIKRKDMQRQQYIVQESDNGLYGRAAVSIKSVMIGREDDGHEFALYVIEVKRQAGEQMPAATWAIARRYSQFHEMHKRLRARFPAVREFDFPRRQALFTLQKDFVQKRRVVLERYLKSLLLVPAICGSQELRAFLSQSAVVPTGNNGARLDPKDFVTRIYNSVSDGMEEFVGNIPVLDQLSVAGQNLISATTPQAAAAPLATINQLDSATQDPATAAEAEVELRAYDAKEAEPFVKPICDLFLETFELSKGNNWLRGRTVVVVLHQLLGGTIERKVREFIRNAFEDKSLVRYVDLLKSSLWPDGQPRQPAALRTSAEKGRSRQEASLILDALVSDSAGGMVGKSNARAASRKIFAMVNNQKLKYVDVHTATLIHV